MTPYPAAAELLIGDALSVAPALIGWRLQTGFGGEVTSGRIIEVEAYLGTDDPASHAYRGLTPRNAPMFMAGGTVYVYLSYGIHACMNLVTGPNGHAQAVLIRAIAPEVGLDVMAQRRGLTKKKRLAQGPGNVCQALRINLAMSGSRIGSEIKLLPPLSPAQPGIIATERVGISRAVERKWRFIES